MKKLFKYVSLSVIAGLLALSCTDDFEKYNTNPEGIYDSDLLADDNLVAAYFPSIQRSIYFNYSYGSGTDWTFQLYQNLNADMYSGLLSSPTPFGGASNLTYSMVDGWNSFAWNTVYGYTMSTVLRIDKKIEENPSVAIYKAWVNILKVAAMHRITDIYGPIIYTQFGKTELGAPYDDQKTAYYKFFEELNLAATDLTAYEKANPENKRFQKVDLIYGGDMKMWVKYANSLRLRLALNIAKVDPTKAKQEAEAAVSHEWGVIESVSQNAKVSSMMHPLATVGVAWSDCMMSADIESILKGYGDPRISKYFQPASDDKIKGQYKGIRLGVNQTKSVYVGSSSVNISSGTPPVLASASEVAFLKAEGALRGWNMGGTAKELYEKGIQLSFEQYDINNDSYLKSNSLPANYEDLIISANSHKAVNLVSPSWDDTASNEIKLQKIITQKWIALYPDGGIAWTDVRRTGYPKLFPVVQNLSQGVVSTDLGPRRIPFPSSEAIDNTTNYNDGVSKLGGPDNAATRLWWDVAGKGNF